MLYRRGTGAFNKTKSDNPQVQDESMKYSLRDTEKRIRTQRNQIQGTTRTIMIPYTCTCTTGVCAFPYAHVHGEISLLFGVSLSNPEYTKDRNCVVVAMQRSTVPMYSSTCILCIVVHVHLICRK